QTDRLGKSRQEHQDLGCDGRNSGPRDQAARRKDESQRPQRRRFHTRLFTGWAMDYFRFERQENQGVEGRRRIVRARLSESERSRQYGPTPGGTSGLDLSTSIRAGRKERGQRG